MYIQTFPVSHMCHMTRSSNFSQFDHTNEEYRLIDLLVMQSSPFLSYLHVLDKMYVPQRPILKHSKHINMSEYLTGCKS
jgi:hypothetical protein